MNYFLNTHIIQVQFIFSFGIRTEIALELSLGTVAGRNSRDASVGAQVSGRNYPGRNCRRTQLSAYDHS
jgi:hypothetical protein